MEFIAVITDKGTGKRIRLKDIEPTSRARRGVLILREVKTNPHKVVKTFVTDSRNLFGIKSSTDIKMIKASELTIMDRYSTGSSIYKGKIKDAFEVVTLTKNNGIIGEEKVSEVIEEPNHNEYRQLSLLDVDDSLHKIDDMLDNIDDDL